MTRGGRGARLDLLHQAIQLSRRIRIISDQILEPARPLPGQILAHPLHLARRDGGQFRTGPIKPLQRLRIRLTSPVWWWMRPASCGRRAESARWR